MDLLDLGRKTNLYAICWRNYFLGNHYKNFRKKRPDIVFVKWVVFKITIKKTLAKKNCEVTFWVSYIQHFVSKLRSRDYGFSSNLQSLFKFDKQFISWLKGGLWQHDNVAHNHLPYIKLHRIYHKILKNLIYQKKRSKLIQKISPLYSNLKCHCFLCPGWLYSSKIYLILLQPCP